MLINQRILVDVIFLHHFGQFPTMYTSHISMVQATNTCQQSSNWIGQIDFTLYVHRYLQCNKDLYLGVGASRSVQLCEQEKITDIKLMFYLRFYTCHWLQGFDGDENRRLKHFSVYWKHLNFDEMIVKPYLCYLSLHGYVGQLSFFSVGNTKVSFAEGTRATWTNESSQPSINTNGATSLELLHKNIS